MAIFFSPGERQLAKEIHQNAAILVSQWEAGLVLPHPPWPHPGGPGSLSPGLGCEPLCQEQPAGELQLVFPSPSCCSAPPATLAAPTHRLLCHAKVSGEGRVSLIPRNLQSKQRGLPYRWENKG